MPDFLTDLSAVLGRFLASMEVLAGRVGVGPQVRDLLMAARDATAAWEPLTVDLSAGPEAGEVWHVSRATLHGVCASQPPVANSPIAGIFLVPIGTPEESLADASSPTGWNIPARGIPLPAGVVVSYTAIPDGLGGFTYAYQISLTQSSPVTVRPGQTIRAVLSCYPGTATPGPGAGSFGILTVMGDRVGGA